MGHCNPDVSRGNVSEPKAEYQKRLEKYSGIITGQDRLHVRVGYAKLIVIAAALVLAWLIFASHLLTIYWLSLPLVAYAALGILHGRVLRAKAHAESSAD